MKRAYKIGIRQLQLEIEREYGVWINRKRIHRIKREAGIETYIRKKRTKYQMNSVPHTVFPNILNREFTASRPMEKVVTDITQINIAGGQKVYLIAFKDLYDKSIISYEVSSNLNLNFVNKALKRVLNKKRKGESLLIHSDQGGQFISRIYVRTLKENNVIQSMSRRGNCWDNAPIESFFGLLKDHLEPKKAKNLEGIKKHVARKIFYYNHERPQLGLKKMSPVEYRRHAA